MLSSLIKKIGPVSGFSSCHPIDGEIDLLSTHHDSGHLIINLFPFFDVIYWPERLFISRLLNAG